MIYLLQPLKNQHLPQTYLLKGENMFQKPRRFVNEVFLHHSATDYFEHDNPEYIREVHVKQNGWRDIGYHYFINSHGEIFECRNLEEVPASQAEHNQNTISICLSGVGQSFTKKQFKSLKKLCKEINKEYDTNVSFKGHKEVNATECPHYDYKNILNLDDTGKMKPPFWFKMLRKVIQYIVIKKIT